MDSQPATYQIDSELSLLDGSCDEFERRGSFDLNVVTVDAEKGIRGREANSLIPVDERMIVCEGFHQCRRFMYQVVVVTALRAKDSRFEQTPIAYSLDTTEFLYEPAMNFKRFRDGKIEKPGHLFCE